jgi:hypothetical protein
MSIANKLITVAENQQKVYDAGFVAGQNSGGGGGYDEGFSAGQQAEYDRFWDAYQENGNRTEYVEGFCRRSWNADTYNPKYPITGVNYGFQSTFSNSSITDTKVDLILRGGNNMRATFNMCTRMVRIPSLILEVPVTDAASAFHNCLNLEEINVSCVNDGCFAVSLSLQHSSKLTPDSVTSVINALKDLTGQTAQKVQFHTDVLSRLTAEQAEAITAKNWTI